MIVVPCIIAGIVVGVVIARMGIAMGKLHRSNTKARTRGLP